MVDLISGVGLLLLTMTNRLGRAIDRARLIRSAIALASISALMAAALVIALFFSALLGVDAPWVIMSLFVACLASLISSLVLFSHDVNQSLAALKLEIGSRGIDL